MFVGLQNGGKTTMVSKLLNTEKSFLTATSIVSELHFMSLKWLSVAKLKARSEASRQNISYYDF